MSETLTRKPEYLADPFTPPTTESTVEGDEPLVLDAAYWAQRRAERQGTADGTTASTESAPQDGTDTAANPDVDPATLIEGPFKMWTPVNAPAATGPKPKEAYTWAPAAKDMDPWVRSLDKDQLSALDSIVRRYRGIEEPAPTVEAPAPATEVVEKPTIHEAATDPAWILDKQSAETQAAVASVAEQYADKRADLAMIPETPAEDEAWLRAGTDPTLRQRAFDKLTYRFEKKRRELAASAAAAAETGSPEEAAEAQEAERKVGRLLRWMGQGVVRSAITTGERGGQLR